MQQLLDLNNKGVTIDNMPPYLAVNAWKKNFIRSNEMRIFNESKTQELFSYDAETGHLKPDKLLLKHHEAVFCDGGHWSLSIQLLPEWRCRPHLGLGCRPQQAQEAWDEYEDIAVYVPFTAEELQAKRANEIKRRLGSELSGGFVQVWAGGGYRWHWGQKARVCKPSQRVERDFWAKSRELRKNLPLRRRSNGNNIIYQGSTPMQEITLPIPTDLIKEAIVTYLQKRWNCFWKKVSWWNFVQRLRLGFPTDTRGNIFPWSQQDCFDTTCYKIARRRCCSFRPDLRLWERDTTRRFCNEIYREFFQSHLMFPQILVAKTKMPTGFGGGVLINGKDGKSAYQIAVDKGFEGSEDEWPLLLCKARTGKDGQNGIDGKDGKNGISVQHRWQGTTLTITSESGTSSWNSKAKKGDKGDKGEKGDTGAQERRAFKALRATRAKVLA